jgi:hypothetical protein
MDIAVQIFLITLLIGLTIIAAVGAATIIWIMVKDLVDDIRETVRKE